MISFIVPAHNEETALGRTLPAIHEAARATGQPYEVIVVNDASTDGTAEVARRHQALVVPVNHRQIAATRNSGARAARGERFFFIDADTTINARAVASALRSMDKGAVGGGAMIWFEGPLPLYAYILNPIACLLCKAVGFTGGAFIFCTSEAFRKTGGFDERLFCGEENVMVLELKKQGRFVVSWEGVRTSGRRLRTLSGLRALALVAGIVRSPLNITKRAKVEKVWYDSNRSRDDILPDSIAVRISNAITLALVLVLVTGPLWNFIPWSWVPRGTLRGDFRMTVGFFLSHVGLLFWPISAVFLWSLCFRSHWFKRLKTAAVLAVCLWQAWDSTQGVIWHWTQIYRWLA